MSNINKDDIEKRKEEIRKKRKMKRFYALVKVFGASLATGIAVGSAGEKITDNYNGIAPSGVVSDATIYDEGFFDGTYTDVDEDPFGYVEETEEEKKEKKEKEDKINKIIKINKRIYKALVVLKYTKVYDVKSADSYSKEDIEKCKSMIDNYPIEEISDYDRKKRKNEKIYINENIPEMFKEVCVEYLLSHALHKDLKFLLNNYCIEDVNDAFFKTDDLWSISPKTIKIDGTTVSYKDKEGKIKKVSIDKDTLLGHLAIDCDDISDYEENTYRGITKEAIKVYNDIQTYQYSTIRNGFNTFAPRYHKGFFGDVITELYSFKEWEKQRIDRDLKHY